MPGAAVAIAAILWAIAFAPPAAAETGESLPVPASTAESTIPAEVVAAMPAEEVPVPEPAAVVPEASRAAESATAAAVESASTSSPPPSASFPDQPVSSAPSEVVRVAAETGRDAVETTVAAIEGTTQTVRDQTPQPAEVLDFATSSAKEIASPVTEKVVPPLAQPRLGFDLPALLDGAPSSATVEVPSLSGPGGGNSLVAERILAAVEGSHLWTYLDAFGGIEPPHVEVGHGSTSSAGSLSGMVAAADVHLESFANRPSKDSPLDRPAPPFQSPGTAAGSGGSLFVPLAALLALLALAAPATFRRRMEVPDFLAPTPFVCALERPG